MDTTRWERIQEIFHAASELDPALRQRFLDGACAGEADLRREVESYLGALDVDEDAISQALQAEAASMMQVAAGPAPGDLIGPYRLIRKIGQGGMGAVYLAQRDDQEYHQQVAIKLIRFEKAGAADLLRRFRTERQILATLIHPNIARLLDGGIASDGTPYFVMEHVDGVPIDEYCRAHALPLRQRIQLFRAVCAAVQYAHRSLVVHRDIKPSNILVTADGVPKLLDFGLAKLLRPGEADHAAFSTRPAERMMTLEYASPEQVRGEPVTTATDVYSLATVLYELLAGERPFNLKKKNFLDAQRAICETEPRRPSAVVAPTERRHLKGDLDSIVLMAMRKEPESRYPSVEQFSEDLRCYLEGFPVGASKGATPYYVAKFVARHRVGVALSAGMAVLLVAFAIGMGVLAARVRRERDDARVQRASAEQISNFLTGLFSSSDPYETKNGSAVTAKQLLDNGFHRIGHDLQSQPKVRAELLQTMARAYQHLGLQADAQAAYTEQVHAAEQGYGAGSLPVATALRQLADVERQRTNLPDAEAHLRQALAIQQRLSPPGDAEISHTLNNLGLVLQSRGEVAAAEPLFRQAVAISKQHPSEITQTLTMMGNLAGVLSDRARYAEAEPLLRDVLAQRKKLLGDNHPQVAISMNRLARVLDREGKWTEAARLQREALNRQRTLLGEEHLDYLASTNNLAYLLQEQGNLDEAEALYRKAVETGTRALGETGDVALWTGNLASVLAERGDFAQADGLFRKALAICRAKIGAGTTREARLLNLYGSALAAVGRSDAAEESLQQALATEQKLLGSNHPEVAVTLFDLGILRRVQGKTAAAEELFRQALAVDRASLPEGHLQTAEHQLAWAEQAAGRPDGAVAEPSARQALDWRKQALPAGAWQIDDANATLGMTLAKLGRYTEAEPLILEGYAGLKRRFGERNMITKLAAARLADLHLLAVKMERP